MPIVSQAMHCAEEDAELRIIYRESYAFVTNQVATVLMCAIVSALAMTENNVTRSRTNQFFYTTRCFFHRAFGLSLGLLWWAIW
jgi:hypothetical protein